MSDDLTPTAGTTPVEQYLTWPARRRGPYGWGRVALAVLLLVVGCMLTVTVVGSALALAAPAEGQPKSPAQMVLQLAAVGVWAVVVVVLARVLFQMRAGDLVSWVPGVR